ANRRPDELHRLRKILRIGSPAETAPEGGLKITNIAYTGAIWQFTEKPQDDGSILLLAHAKNPDGTIPNGKYEEQVVLTTNHPNKPTITLTFLTAIDPNAGGEGSTDPWAGLR
ncbi:MAG: hypothetical protein PF961_09205, partial [Planctomycetota bacterium]|nr:hypothetical protein [Planctomycetota bacterium]